MTYRYSIQAFRALLIRLSALLVGGGTIEWGPLRIVVEVEPAEADPVREPVSP